MCMCHVCVNKLLFIFLLLIYLLFIQFMSQIREKDFFLPNTPKTGLRQAFIDKCFIWEWSMETMARWGEEWGRKRGRPIKGVFMGRLPWGQLGLSPPEDPPRDTQENSVLAKFRGPHPLLVEGWLSGTLASWHFLFPLVGQASSQNERQHSGRQRCKYLKENKNTGTCGNCLWSEGAPEGKEHGVEGN